ncbi:hypothetical protein [Bradyrhizobium sp. AZCC 2289]|uniref:hypothetical protein n=1 Tax=Bradyrhizobium sp. AZCC 2289 TaxID=3117026 RepID=UPI002FEFC85D
MGENQMHSVLFDIQMMIELAIRSAETWGADEDKEIFQMRAIDANLLSFSLY